MWIHGTELQWTRGGGVDHGISSISASWGRNGKRRMGEERRDKNFLKLSKNDDYTKFTSNLLTSFEINVMQLWWCTGCTQILQRHNNKGHISYLRLRERCCSRLWMHWIPLLLADEGSRSRRRQLRRRLQRADARGIRGNAWVYVTIFFLSHTEIPLSWHSSFPRVMLWYTQTKIFWVGSVKSQV